MEDKELIEKIVKFIESDKWDTLTNLSESIVQLIRSAGYVQLAEDQTPPKISDEGEEDGVVFCAGQGWMINKMLTPHKEGERTTVWKKIIMERER